MHFDLHLGKTVQEQLSQLVDKMKGWEESTEKLASSEVEQIVERLNSFPHTTRRPNLHIAGVDGSGDFPSLSYADSFIYFTVAQATIYSSDELHGLKEIAPIQPPIINFAWIPEDPEARKVAFDEAFAALAGMPVEKVIEQSDFRLLSPGKAIPTSVFCDGLIRPHAADSGNIGIQLRSSGELAAALHLIQNAAKLDYLLIDGTLSLPFIGKGGTSLFHEHLKRLCCVKATEKRIGLFALSKSHGLPSIELIEQIVRQKLGIADSQTAEHWFLRLPVPKRDEWEFSLAEGRFIPPASTVSYLVRFHKRSPLMRLDMDKHYWDKVIVGENDSETQANEQKIFADLDYSCHDQRCYGYPYPIKAGHDRASMTKQERLALRKQIIDKAVSAGMKRSLFQDVSVATGHK